MSYSISWAGTGGETSKFFVQATRLVIQDEDLRFPIVTTVSVVSGEYSRCTFSPDGISSKSMASESQIYGDFKLKEYDL